MKALSQKSVVVLGGSRGVGRAIVETLGEAGANVLAVARGQDGLTLLHRERPEVETLALDVSEATAPDAVFARMKPDVLVVCAGAIGT